MAAVETLEARYGIEEPYTITFKLHGLTPFLFHRFADLEGYVEDRVAKKRKPREAESTDYERLVWRDDDGLLAVPTLNVIAAIVGAGRYFKSPISGSGGATTTLREALIVSGEWSSFGVEQWDCVDFRLARNSDMKRSPKPTWRPRLEKGWTLTAGVGIVTPEFYSPTKLIEVLARAGTTGGIGDGRKIGFGRFATAGFEVEEGLPW